MYSKILPLLFMLFGLPAYSQVKVTFNINTNADRKIISPLIYGTNDNYKHAAAKRFGGNRITNYNWENNASNAGRDWFHESDNYVPWEQGVDEADYNVPGAAVKSFHTRSLQQKAYSLITLPMAKYVAADKNGGVSEAQSAPSGRWVNVKYTKPGALSLFPNLADNTVYNDEEINFLIHHFGRSNTSTGVKGYALDNEPGLWFDSHSRMWGPGHVPVSYLLDNSVELATRIKQMDPTSEVFGPASWGVSEFETLQDAPDWADVRGNYVTFIDYYLAKMKERGGANRLLDVLDVHWYPQGRNDGLSPFNNSSDYATSAARMEMTRSLWDSTYRENTWIGTDGWKVEQFLPFIPKMNKHINTYYPGTKLAITEYSYMGTGHPSGGIAQADALGIFGKLGLYLATYWGGVIDYVKAGFDIYRNYDGKGGQFGDISVNSVTSDITNSSVHASIESANQGRTHIIAMNKNQDGPIVATININSDRAYKSARVWAFDRSSSAMRQIRNVRVINDNKFDYTIPALTACHIVLTEEDLSVYPDFDGVKITPEAGWSDGTATFDIVATIYDGDKDIQKVTADLTPVGGPAAAALKLTSAAKGEYKLTYKLPATAVSGLKMIKLTATDAQNHSGESTVQYRVIKKTQSSMIWDADSVTRGVGEHFFDPADSLASKQAKIQRITTGGNNKPGSLFMHFIHGPNKYNMMTWRISNYSNPADGRDISDFGFVEFYIRSNAPAGSDIEFSMRDASAELGTSATVALKRDGYLSAFSPTSYSRVRIPIAALTAGSEVHLDQIWQFNFSANTASKGFDVWVDDIRVLPYSHPYKAPAISGVSQIRESGYSDGLIADAIAADVTDPDNDLKSVTVDLSEVNGPNNLVMPRKTGNRYKAAFTIPKGVSPGVKKLKITARDAAGNETVYHAAYKIEQVASDLLIWDGDTKNTGTQIRVNDSTTAKVNPIGGNRQPVSMDIHLDKQTGDFAAVAWDWNEDTYNTELLDLSDKRYLNFYIKITPPSADFDMDVFVKDRFGNDPPGVKLKAGGYVSSFTGQYQLVSIPLARLFGNTDIDKTQMTRVGWLSNQMSTRKLDFKIDDIYASGSMVHDVKMKVTHPRCNVKGAIAIDTILDATGPFNYYINGSANPQGLTNKNFSNLKAGKYLIRITGPDRFVYMEEVILKDEPLILTPVVTPGNAEITVSGGSGNYTYAWSNGAKEPRLIKVAEGNYTLTVTDITTACKASVTVYIPPVPVTMASTRATCAANGTIIVTSKPGGITKVKYFINGRANPAGSSNREFTGLKPGSYTITMTAPGGFNHEQQVVVGGSPSVPVVRASVSGGDITLSITGGSGKFTYAWNTGATTRDLRNMPSGTYTVTVLDTAGGCQTTHTVNLANPSRLLSNNALSVYPNPVKGNGTINIRYEFADKAQRLITLRDLYGKLLSSVTVTEATGDFIISLPGLRAGVYVLKNEGKDPASLKVLVQE
ncbi:glycoside hydrolase family 44 protein [Mucilaginibacter hurinus]|nr:glycoside hydrolase family 44 protein [Mucilaginibacter hurinus]